MWRGLIRESLGLVALLMGVVAFVTFGEAISAMFAAGFEMRMELARLAGYAISFFTPFLAIRITAHFLSNAGKAVDMGGVDRFTGFAFGALIGAILAGAVLAAADHLGLGKSFLSDSSFAGPLKQLFNQILDEAGKFWTSVTRIRL